MLSELSELSQVIQDSLSQLPEDLRTALTLREFEGMSYEEIAKIERIVNEIIRSNSAVSTHLMSPDEAIEKAMIGYKIIIPLEGLIDPELELSRLTKELSKVENDIKIINSKLSNEQFVAKAPEAVIIKEKEKLASAVEKKSMVESSLLKLNS